MSETAKVLEMLRLNAQCGRRFACASSCTSCSAAPHRLTAAQQCSNEQHLRQRQPASLSALHVLSSVPSRSLCHSVICRAATTSYPAAAPHAPGLAFFQRLHVLVPELYEMLMQPWHF